METKNSTVSFNSVRYLTQPLRPRNPGEATVYDRFQRLPGADQNALSNAHVLLVGCGGLNGEVGQGLARKGIGRLTLCDHDLVELSNLARQQFGVEDLDKNKALALAAHLARQSTGRTLIEGHAYSFQEAAVRGVNLRGHLVVVGVDNQATRIAAARHYLQQRTPVIFLAVDERAAKGYAFVQTSQPGDPCFLCLFPDAAEDRRVHGCAGASIEILKIVAGMALYAIDSLLMARPRSWNYKDVYLDQGQDGQRTIRKRPACSLCA
jgi:molybdopterin/thiamine biosynthesis adenylyltransferase